MQLRIKAASGAEKRSGEAKSEAAKRRAKRRSEERSGEAKSEAAKRRAKSEAAKRRAAKRRQKTLLNFKKIIAIIEKKHCN